MKGSKKKTAAKLAAASLLVGSISGLNLESAQANQLLAFKALGSGVQIRANILNDNADSKQKGTYAADKTAPDKSAGEGKCGEGKCGEDKKPAPQKATPNPASKDAEMKCGEGKCGE